MSIENIQSISEELLQIEEEKADIVVIKNSVEVVPVEELTGVDLLEESIMTPDEILVKNKAEELLKRWQPKRLKVNPNNPNEPPRIEIPGEDSLNTLLDRGLIDEEMLAQKLVPLEAALWMALSRQPETKVIMANNEEIQWIIDNTVSSFLDSKKQ
jgi:hypothetical protein